ncbi:hypothetical protein PLICRDRAFT_145169 [Plicaturopsis crispa FD-325 SS-3]|nr:hypothetical protein PLICRDRAFT_145169 [Plicaturopsis crispa FD-325 SS-3]
MNVTLEEFYNGATKTIRVHRSVTCTACFGHSGAKIPTWVGCELCGSQPLSYEMLWDDEGRRRENHSQRCNVCPGRGRIVDNGVEAWMESCSACGTSGKVLESKTLEVHILKGMVDGHMIRFVGEGRQPIAGFSKKSGDTTVTLVEQPHKRFARDRKDLHRPLYVDLVTLWRGGMLRLRHLDGEYLHVRVSPWSRQFRAWKSRKVIRGEGMPSDPTEDPGLRNQSYGDLYLDVIVKFPPVSRSPAVQYALSRLAKVLPRDQDVLPYGSSVTDIFGRKVELERVDLEDEDDEDEGWGMDVVDDDDDDDDEGDDDEGDPR